MTIFVVTHKPYCFPKSTDYVPIQVGNIFDENKLSDSTGINIANKNKNYCELTALYWIWKNNNEENIGLVHYRRYFSGDLTFGDVNIADKNYLDTLLSEYDLILPIRLDIDIGPVYYQWAASHNLNDWIGIGEVISKLYPDYMQSFFEVSESRKMYAYNMFYSRKKLISGYCEWLFDILFEYEKKIELTEYDIYQSRLFGFLSERLFNIWIVHNRLNVYECPVILLEHNEKNNKKNNIGHKLIKIYLLIKIKIKEKFWSLIYQNFKLKKCKR